MKGFVTVGKSIMENKKIKIAMVTNHFGITGIGTVIMNYCKALDENKYDLTILTGKPIAESYKCGCEVFDIKLIALPSRRQNKLRHYYGLLRELRKGKFDIVHIHGSSSMMAIELFIAKIAGIKVRIAHSHSCCCSHMKLQNILNLFLKKLYTMPMACSNIAGDWLFGCDNYTILPNGFDTIKFIFSEQERHRVRRELGVENKFVLGHVGRFNETKNQKYLLDIFENIGEKYEDTYLLLIGTGPDFDIIKELVHKHPFSERIILYGESDDISSLYSAMDVFLFPSLYEGLGLVAVEAQISGLPCVISDKVPKIVEVGENVSFLPIGAEGEKAWGAQIAEYKTLSLDRTSVYTRIESKIHKFDMISCASKLENIYDSLMKK